VRTFLCVVFAAEWWMDGGDRGAFSFGMVRFW
jgi:hypothetical protein